MSRFDQAKMLMKMKKMDKELEREIISVEQGDGAVRIEISGKQKVKKIHIDPERVDLGGSRIIKKWIENAFKEAIDASQKLAAERMRPFMGALGDLGL